MYELGSRTTVPIIFVDKDLRLTQLGRAILTKLPASHPQLQTFRLTQEPEDRRLLWRWEEEIEGLKDDLEDAVKFYEKAIRLRMSYGLGCHWFMMSRTTRILEGAQEFEYLEGLNPSWDVNAYAGEEVCVRKSPDEVGFQESIVGLRV